MKYDEQLTQQIKDESSFIIEEFTEHFYVPRTQRGEPSKCMGYVTHKGVPLGRHTGHINGLTVTIRQPRRVTIRPGKYATLKPGNYFSEISPICGKAKCIKGLVIPNRKMTTLNVVK